MYVFKKEKENTPLGLKRETSSHLDPRGCVLPEDYPTLD